MGKRKPWCQRTSPGSPALELSIGKIAKRQSRVFRLGYLARKFLKACAQCVVVYVVYLAILAVAGFSTGAVRYMVLILAGFVFLIMLPLFIVGFSFFEVGQRQLEYEVIASRCQRCVYCFYDLSRRARDHDICPECGQFTPRRECVRLWCKLLRSRF